MAREHVYLSLTDAAMTVWTGTAARLEQTHAFDSDDESAAVAFDAYIEANRHAVFSIVLDLPDEDCRLETVPHVSARDRNRVLARRLQQLYRETPYRNATQQGRETTGRRDDRVLFSALTDTAKLSRWLHPMQQRDVRIAGIYSITLLTAGHAREIKSIPRRALIVSRHAGSGLRQTYIADGSLRFSRLTPLEGEGLAALAVQLAAEAARARQFLASLRAIERTEVMQVLLLCGEHEVADMQALCPPSELVQYHFLPLARVAKALKVHCDPRQTTAEAVWLREVAVRHPPNQYATPTQRKSYIATRIGRFMLVGATLLMVAGALASANYLIAAADLQTKVSALQARQAAAERLYAENVPKAAPGEMSPTGMKNVVTSYRALVEQWPELAQSLQRVSGVLRDFPMVELDELSWQATTDIHAPFLGSTEGATPTAAAATGAPAPQVDAAGNPLPARMYVLLLLKGNLPGYFYRYREALATVHALAKQFERQPGVQVEEQQLPIDVTPGGKIDLSTEAAATTDSGAPFVLKVVIPLPAPAAVVADQGGGPPQ